MKYISYFLIVLLLLTFLNPVTIYSEENNLSEIIAYQLKIVELTEVSQEKIGLREFEYNFPGEKIFSFFREADLLKAVGVAGRTMLNLDIYNNQENENKVSDVILLTLFDEEVNLSLSEEIVSLNTGNVTSAINRTEEVLNISLIPVYRDRDENVLTDLIIRSGENTGITTTIWSESNSGKLVGLVRWDMDSSISGSLTKGETSRARYFAVQISHQIVTSEESQAQKIVDLNQFDQLLWPEEEKKIEFASYFQILSNLDIDIMVMDYERKLAYKFEANDGLNDLTFGLDAIVHEDLKLGIRGMNLNGEINLGIVLSERVIISPHFKIAGSYYPIYYDFSNKEFKSGDIWSAELEFIASPLSARLKYRTGLSDNDEIMISAGYQFRESMELIAGAIGDIEGVNQYIVGIKFDF